jgi:aminobenzoyl-glutamate utilization protein B
MRARATLTLVALLLAWEGARASAQPLGDTLARIDTSAQQFGPLAQRIWELAEAAYREHESVALLKEELRAAGFEIDDGVAGIPTAFVASWGRGRPAIGIIGEYDALPGLSQEALPQKKPRVAGAAGHGCGHNLLGAASVMAALAVKDGLLARQAPGTIRLYGAPAGDAGGAKVFMLRSGLFSDLDAALTWHPGDRNQALNAGSLALIEGRLRFHGQVADAARPSETGRSGLDALRQAAQALEQLREQLPRETRLEHHVATNGGAGPGAGADVAELSLLVRHPEQNALDGVWARALESARAAARATGTTLYERVVGACANVLPNEPLAKLIDQNLRRAGGIQYSAEEKAFAEALRRTASLEGAPPLGSQEAIQPLATGYVAGSTEVGDVSWVVPTGQLTTATYVPGTPGRSWQSTACAGSGIGRKGMVVAAKALALTALDLLTDSEQLAAARAAFQAGKAGAEYRSRLPLDARPALASEGAPEPPRF